MALRSERKSISINEVESGMMIEFSYTKKSGDNNSYIILVIDPSKSNKYTGEPQLHGFVIERMSDAELLEFFSSFNKNTTLEYSDTQSSVIEGLNTDEAYSTFASSKYVKDRSYRTFNLSSMSQIRQVLLGSAE